MTSECRAYYAGDPILEAYHDDEWSKVNHDDRFQFEMLCLEGASVGLSWKTIMHKREAYRKAFHNFEIDACADMTEEELEALMENPGLIRNKGKIFSVRKNARVVQQIQKEFGSFDAYLWSFVPDGKVIDGRWKSVEQMPTKSAISAAMAKDMKKRGIQFVGPVITYSFLQSIGIVNDHLAGCAYRGEEKLQVSADRDGGDHLPSCTVRGEEKLQVPADRDGGDQGEPGRDFPSCVIFDLDGTLLDTSPGILECVRYAAKKRGYPELSEEILYTFIGPPLRDSFMRCYGCSAQEADALTAAYREHYREGALLKARPYEGIFELLNMLRGAGCLLAVATSKPQTFAEQILRHFGFEFSIINGADLEGRLTKADLIRKCVTEAGALPKECVMVGDTEHDARGAAEAGVPFIGVRYGFGNPEKMLAYPCRGLAAAPKDIINCF